MRCRPRRRRRPAACGGGPRSRRRRRRPRRSQGQRSGGAARPTRTCAGRRGRRSPVRRGRVRPEGGGGHGEGERTQQVPPAEPEVRARAPSGRGGDGWRRVAGRRRDDDDADYPAVARAARQVRLALGRVRALERHDDAVPPRHRRAVGVDEAGLVGRRQGHPAGAGRVEGHHHRGRREDGAVGLPHARRRRGDGDRAAPGCAAVVEVGTDLEGGGPHAGWERRRASRAPGRRGR